MIDSKRIYENSELIKASIAACVSLSGKGRHRTSYRSKLLSELLEVATDCPERPEGFKIDICPLQGSQLLPKICLASGGADSTIAWYLYGKPQGIYVDIGQSYNYKELDCIERIGLPTFHVDLLPIESAWKHIIPGRNFLFLTIAAEYLQDKGTLIFGVTEGEGWNSGKGDKSEKFVSMWQYWYYTLTGKTITVETLISDTKAGWLDWFIKSGYDINIIRHNTVTCFNGQMKPCGECQACLRKYLSFMNNGIDIAEDFTIHPMIGSDEYVNKYKKNLKEALTMNNFSHYSLKRCTQDLEAIDMAEASLK